MEITTASKITIARLFLIIPTAIFFIVGEYVQSVYLPFMILAEIFFVLTCATDFIDGNLARKTNTVTDLGKFLDPLADKVVIVVMLFLIVYFRDGIELFTGSGMIIAVTAGLVLSRELVVSVFRAVAAKKGIVLAADVFGKLKTVFLDIGVAVLILSGLHIVFGIAGLIFYYIGVFFAIYSGFNYIIKNKQVLKDEKVETKKEKIDEN